MVQMEFAWLNLIGQVVSEKMFENNGHIHVHVLGRDRQQEHNSSDNLVIGCNFFQLNDFETHFSPFKRKGKFDIVIK